LAVHFSDHQEPPQLSLRFFLVNFYDAIEQVRDPASLLLRCHCWVEGAYGGEPLSFAFDNELRQPLPRRNRLVAEQQVREKIHHDDFDLSFAGVFAQTFVQQNIEFTEVSDPRNLV